MFPAEPLDACVAIGILQWIALDVFIVASVADEQVSLAVGSDNKIILTGESLHLYDKTFW